MSNHYRYIKAVKYKNSEKREYCMKIKEFKSKTLQIIVTRHNIFNRINFCITQEYINGICDSKKNTFFNF